MTVMLYCLSARVFGHQFDDLQAMYLLTDAFFVAALYSGFCCCYPNPIIAWS
jgi:hypothetical protein